jgi:lysophospholipase L1-like esterase
MEITFFGIFSVLTLIYLIITLRAVERLERTHYEQRADLYRSTKIRQGDIVLIGDSLTDGGNWEELFPGVPVKNRGINADNTIGVLERINDIVCCGPAGIFIMIGTNDLNWWEFHRGKIILETYEKILVRIKERSPKTRVFVQSILPRKKRFANRIQALNLSLNQLAEQYGYTYIDLFSHFCDERLALKSGFTNDHLHLLAAGYQEWVKVLAPYIDSFGKK